MIDTKELIEIRLHGRGGQGAVSSAELVARAAISEGKYASAFPAFGAERRGAPVIAFLRIGLKDKGTLIINTAKSLQEVESEFKSDWRLALVDATKIAQELLGVPIVNTSMIGALLKAAEVVKIESLLEPLQYHFPRLAERNMNAIKRAYEETIVKE